MLQLSSVVTIFYYPLCSATIALPGSLHSGCVCMCNTVGFGHTEDNGKERPLLPACNNSFAHCECERDVSHFMKTSQTP